MNERADMTVFYMTIAADRMEQLAALLVDTLDKAHDQGLAIPSRVPEAVAVLQALGACWQANSIGHPAPAAAKATLGLPGEVTPCPMLP